jgi:hypothetical protein
MWVSVVALVTLSLVRVLVVLVVLVAHHPEPHASPTDTVFMVGPLVIPTTSLNHWHQMNPQHNQKRAIED